LELSIHKVAQAASGGSHVTIYEAEVEFVASGVQVEVLGVHPNDALPAYVDVARDAIRRGAEKVLQSRGQGAIIRIKRLVIHPIDFKPRKFEQYTAEELARLLAETGAEPDAAPDRGDRVPST
jgi:hypothetical protein